MVCGGLSTVAKGSIRWHCGTACSLLRVKLCPNPYQDRTTLLAKRGLYVLPQDISIGSTAPSQTGISNFPHESCQLEEERTEIAALFYILSRHADPTIGTEGLEMRLSALDSSVSWSNFPTHWPILTQMTGGYITSDFLCCRTLLAPGFRDKEGTSGRC
jgi:hypothetical protein